MKEIAIIGIALSATIASFKNKSWGLGIISAIMLIFAIFKFIWWTQNGQ